LQAPQAGGKWPIFVDVSRPIAIVDLGAHTAPHIESLA
jgi:hypothetical protein